MCLECENGIVFYGKTARVVRLRGRGITMLKPIVELELPPYEGGCAHEADMAIKVGTDLCNIRSGDRKKRIVCANCPSPYRLCWRCRSAGRWRVVVQPPTGRGLCKECDEIVHAVAVANDAPVSDVAVPAVAQALPPVETITIDGGGFDGIEAGFQSRNVKRPATRRGRRPSSGKQLWSGELDKTLITAGLGRVHTLSPSQYRVLSLSSQGINDSEISGLMDLAKDSIAPYRTAIYRKLRISHLGRGVKFATMVAIYQARVAK